MDIIPRMEALFSEFRNDLVEFGEKKRKLPHFTEMLRSPEGLPDAAEGARSIIARGHGRCWLCKITEEKATEKEVMELVRGSEKNKASHTRVLLALRGIDENAKLLAKEKRILTLGLSRINLLMDLYGKSPIVFHE